MLFFFWKLFLVGGFNPTPPKNIWVRQIGSSSQVLGKIKYNKIHVPNHQPVICFSNSHVQFGEIPIYMPTLYSHLNMILQFQWTFCRYCIPMPQMLLTPIQARKSSIFHGDVLCPSHVWGYNHGCCINPHKLGYNLHSYIVIYPLATGTALPSRDAEVSWNRGTSKSFMSVGFFIVNHPAIGVPPWLWKPPYRWYICGHFMYPNAKRHFFCGGVSPTTQKNSRGESTSNNWLPSRKNN